MAFGFGGFLKLWVFLVLFNHLFMYWFPHLFVCLSLILTMKIFIHLFRCFIKPVFKYVLIYWLMNKSCLVLQTSLPPLGCVKTAAEKLYKAKNTYIKDKIHELSAAVSYSACKWHRNSIVIKDTALIICLTLSWTGCSLWRMLIDRLTDFINEKSLIRQCLMSTSYICLPVGDTHHHANEE